MWCAVFSSFEIITGSELRGLSFVPNTRATPDPYKYGQNNVYIHLRQGNLYHAILNKICPNLFSFRNKVPLTTFHGREVIMNNWNHTSHVDLEIFWPRRDVRYTRVREIMGIDKYAAFRNINRSSVELFDGCLSEVAEAQEYNVFQDVFDEHSKDLNIPKIYVKLRMRLTYHQLNTFVTY